MVHLDADQEEGNIEIWMTPSMIEPNYVPCEAQLSQTTNDLFPLHYLPMPTEARENFTSGQTMYYSS